MFFFKIGKEGCFKVEETAAPAEKIATNFTNFHEKLPQFVPIREIRCRSFEVAVVNSLEAPQQTANP
jgi:hypothetical protein